MRHHEVFDHPHGYQRPLSATHIFPYVDAVDPDPQNDPLIYLEPERRICIHNVANEFFLGVEADQQLLGPHHIAWCSEQAPWKPADTDRFITI